MRRRLAALPCALLAGCLLAPDRPGATTDGGLADGAPNHDGATNPAFCPGSDDVFGAAVAFDRAGSGYDSVYRVGVGRTRGPLIARFEDLAAGSACAIDSERLLTALGSGATVDALALAPVGSEIHAFVLASADGSAELHDLVESSEGHLVDTTVFSEPGLAPTSVTTATGIDHPAFVAYVPTSPPEVWFGGGHSLGAVQPLRTQAPATDQIVDAEAPFYLAGEIGTVGFATEIIGGSTVDELDVGFGSGSGDENSVTATNITSYETCGTACPAHLARTVRPEYGDSGLVFTPSAGSQQELRLLNDGTFEASSIGPAPNISGSPPPVDVDLNLYDALSAYDLVALYRVGTTAELAVYGHFTAGMSAVTTSTPFTSTADRVLATRAGSARAILVLGEDAADGRCFLLGSDETLGVCPP